MCTVPLLLRLKKVYSHFIVEANLTSACFMNVCYCLLTNCKWMHKSMELVSLCLFMADRSLPFPADFTLLLLSCSLLWLAWWKGKQISWKPFKITDILLVNVNLVKGNMKYIFTLFIWNTVETKRYIFAFPKKRLPIIFIIKHWDKEADLIEQKMLIMQNSYSLSLVKRTVLFHVNHPNWVETKILFFPPFIIFAHDWVFQGNTYLFYLKS